MSIAQHVIIQVLVTEALNPLQVSSNYVHNSAMIHFYRAECTNGIHISAKIEKNVQLHLRMSSHKEHSPQNTSQVQDLSLIHI